MPRSKWKGLFCDHQVLQHVQKVLDGLSTDASSSHIAPPATRPSTHLPSSLVRHAAGGSSTQTLPIQVYSRRSAILPEFVGYRFEVRPPIILTVILSHER